MKKLVVLVALIASITFVETYTNLSSIKRVLTEDECTALGYLGWDSQNKKCRGQ